MAVDPRGADLARSLVEDSGRTAAPHGAEVLPVGADWPGTGG